MRIAFLVTRSDTVGGSHIHVRDLATSLKQDGNEVAVFIGGRGPLIEYFIDYGLNIINIPVLKRNISPVNDIRAYVQIKKKLRNFNPDLVSTHSSKAGFLGRLVASKLKIPVLFTAHGWSFTTGKKSVRRLLYQSLEKMIAPKTDRMITVSEYDKKLAVQNLHISPQ
ncbi:MAG: glycosyltransferase, partial [Balneolaceae bacterium]|nr:glycosyltransferase [Balneolaceae bacterium]